MKREREKFEKEKETIKQEMKRRDAQLEDLLKQLKDKSEQISLLESHLPPDERETKQKLYNYSKNLEQLTLMYQSLGTQKNLMAKEKIVAEKKLMRNKELIKKLEENIRVTTE